MQSFYIYRKLIVLSSAACFCLGLPGCVAVKYDTLAFDSQRPATDAPPCLTHSLDKVPECLALVRANQWYSPTGVQVIAGTTYRIVAPSGQQWFDANRRNTPLCGEDGSWIMNLYEKKKRAVDSKWFSVIGVVLRPEAELSVERTQLSQHPQGVCAKDAVHLDWGSYTADASGELALFPNDAIGPPEQPAFFYGNNAGQIWVLISICTNGCKQPEVKRAQAANPPSISKLAPVTMPDSGPAR